MGRVSRNLEASAAAIAARQHGCVTRRQLLESGFGRRAIQRRVRLGVLNPWSPGIYLFGRVEPPLARETAAILACSPRAMLTGRTVAAMRNVPLPGPAPAQMDLLVVGHTRRGLDGVRVRTIDHLGPGELQRLEGLPVASPSLMFVDLAGDLGRDEVADALHDARHRRLVSDSQLRASLAEHPTRRGAGRLRRLLASEEMSFIVESPAEIRCLRMMLRHRLRPSATQARIGPYRVDFLYERERLVVEADSYRHHGDRRAFDEDRRRTAYLMSRGYAVFPVTWADVTVDARATAARLRAALAARRGELAGSMTRRAGR